MTDERIAPNDAEQVRPVDSKRGTLPARSTLYKSIEALGLVVAFLLGWQFGSCGKSIAVDAQRNESAIALGECDDARRKAEERLAQLDPGEGRETGSTPAPIELVIGHEDEQGPRWGAISNDNCLYFGVQFRNDSSSHSVQVSRMVASEPGGPTSLTSLHESPWRSVAPGEIGRHLAQVCRGAHSPFRDGEQYEVEVVAYVHDFEPARKRERITARSSPPRAGAR